ncbi:MAG: hypothetical protein PVH74_13205 [Desulfobacterales bacterium]|jgi:hypothetical protein
MAIYNLDAILNTYGDEYLILDFNHLFISSSIREEVWLLRRKPDMALVEEIMREAKEFGIYDMNEDKDFDTYSGGQKAILGCLLTLAVIRSQEIHGLKLLLNNVLDSLSDDNRSKLLTKFEEIQSTRHIRLFSSEKSHIQEIILKDGN